jgi:diguanylate cyclase (GGDEF)-like protein
MIGAGVICLFMANFMSHTATASLLVPIIAVVGVNVGSNLDGLGGVVALLVSVAFASSLGMSLPISTPPNALAHATGLVDTKGMAKTGVFIGVVGMDFDYVVLSNRVRGIEIYDNGFAYLTDSSDNLLFNPVTHDLLDRAATHNHGFAEEHKALDNGMTLVLHADYSDIQRDSYRMTMLIVAILVVILACFIAITYVLTKRIVRPLKEITSAAENLADGKTDLNLDGCKTQDEIGVLATAFKKTAEKLGGYMNYISSIAYKDSLTGVKNRTAYNEIVTELDLAMELGNCEPFAIVVADINGLKKTNDRYGHEIGNKHIIKAARVICDVFKHSPVYRIGGDEFVVLLRGQDFEARHDLLNAMDEQYIDASITAGEEIIPISVARAMEEYDLGLDFSFDDIFNRADAKMYENKKAMKTLH